MAKQIETLQEKADEVEIRLSGLYQKERDILTAYYIENREAEEIGRNLYFRIYNRTCSAENIYRIIKRAMKKMLEM